MEFFKNMMAKQVNRLKTIKDGHELYFIFLRGVQVATVIGFLILTYYFVFFSDLFRDPILRKMGLGVVSYPLIIGTILAAVSFLISELALRLMDSDKIFGYFLTLILSLWYTFSPAFLLGIFGLYALLNPGAQHRFLTKAPQWYRDLLGFLKINFIKAGEAAPIEKQN